MVGGDDVSVACATPGRRTTCSGHPRQGAGQWHHPRWGAWGEDVGAQMSKPAPDQPRPTSPATPASSRPPCSGVIAVAVAAAEWVGSGKALDSPAGIRAVVALLGVAAMVLGTGLELRRRRQVGLAGPRPAPPRRPRPARCRRRSCSPTSRARPGCSRSWATATRRSATSTRRSCAGRSGRTTASRSAPRATFFAAFASPVAAVAAAVAAQRGLAAQRWPPGSPCGSAWACTPARGCWAATTTSAST